MQNKGGLYRIRASFYAVAGGKERGGRECAVAYQEEREERDTKEERTIPISLCSSFSSLWGGKGNSADIFCREEKGREVRNMRDLLKRCLSRGSGKSATLIIFKDRERSFHRTADFSYL